MTLVVLLLYLRLTTRVSLVYLCLGHELVSLHIWILRAFQAIILCLIQSLRQRSSILTLLTISTLSYGQLVSLLLWCILDI